MHQDRCYAYLIRCMRDIEQVPLKAIRSIIEEFSEKSGIAIPEDVLSAIETFDPTTRKSFVVEIHPGTEDCFIEGTIMNVNPLNLLKYFKYPDSPIGRGLLGRLGKGNYLEVRLRQDQDKQTRESSQFTFLVEKTMYSQAGLKRGARASAALTTYTLPDGRRIWLCKDIFPAI